MGTDLKAKPGLLSLELVPERLNQNLSLEQWSLESCADVLREACGVKLLINVQE